MISDGCHIFANAPNAQMNKSNFNVGSMLASKLSAHNLNCFGLLNVNEYIDNITIKNQDDDVEIFNDMLRNTIRGSFAISEGLIKTRLYIIRDENLFLYIIRVRLCIKEGKTGKRGQTNNFNNQGQIIYNLATIIYNLVLIIYNRVLIIYNRGFFYI